MSKVDISATAQIRRLAKAHPSLTAIVYEGRDVSYSELYGLIERLAASLSEDKVGPGERVAYAGHNSLTFFVTYFAATWVGAAFVPLNFRLAAPETRAVLEDAQPSVLVSEPLQAAVIDPFVDRLGLVRALVVDDDEHTPAAEYSSDMWGSYGDYSASGVTAPEMTSRNDDDLAALLYTSGTTGRAKGVMLTHGNLWWNWVNVDTVVDTRFGDVCFAAAPLFHIGGFNALALRTLTRGGTLIVRRAFQPAQAVRDLVKYRVTSMFLVPAMLASIEREPEFAEADLGALRSTIAAGAPVPPALISRYVDKGVLIQQAWGLTETSPFSTYLEASRTTEKLGSCGIQMPYTQVKVVDPASLEPIAEPGVSGELWVRGPNVSPGYWNNPEATAAAFSEHGWFRTGDLGYMDEEGYIFIVDRLKDMVISGGENVYPAEVENVLNSHPAVADVAVIGVPDDRWGEAVCAVVAFRAKPLTLEEIREFLSGRIARYKLPSRLIVVDLVPRNGAGKLDKPTIRRQLAGVPIPSIATVTAAPFTEAVRTRS